MTFVLAVSSPASPTMLPPASISTKRIPHRNTHKLTAHTVANRASRSCLCNRFRAREKNNIIQISNKFSTTSAPANTEYPYHMWFECVTKESRSNNVYLCVLPNNANDCEIDSNFVAERSTNAAEFGTYGYRVCMGAFFWVTPLEALSPLVD